MIHHFIRMCERFAQMEFYSKKCYVATFCAFFLCGIFLFTPAYCNGQKGPIIITYEGITITRCDVTPQSVSITWSCDDDRITIGESVFKVQARRIKYVSDGMLIETPSSQWVDLEETTGTNLVHEAFTVGEAWEYRIAVDITEQVVQEEAEDGVETDDE
jgi:hypothetical protein